jgi:hypothetical protein
LTYLGQRSDKHPTASEQTDDAKEKQNLVANHQAYNEGQDANQQDGAADDTPLGRALEITLGTVQIPLHPPQIASGLARLFSKGFVIHRFPS